MFIRGAGGGGGGELARGEGAELARPCPRDISGSIPGRIMERGGAMDWFGDGMRCVTIPFVWTCWDTFAMFESPRGTPNPAELFWIIILLPDRFANVVTGPWFMVKIVVPLTGVAAGGCGRLKPPGVFNKTGVE